MIGSMQPLLCERLEGGGSVSPVRALALPLLLLTSLPALAAPPAEPTPLVPYAIGQTRGGIPVVAIAAPGSPWAVVQLHVRLDVADLPAWERRSVEALAQALADGALQGRARPVSGDVAEAGGSTRARVDADALTLSDGAPIDRLDVLLKALDERLRARARLLPATRAVPEAPAADPSIPAEALALAAPGEPVALPATGGSAEPAALRAVADRLLRRDRAALAVVGPGTPSDLLGLVLRTVAAPLPPAPQAPAAPPPRLADGTRLAEARGPGGGPAVTSRVWLVSAGRGAPGASPRDRAARSVLARLAGGRALGTADLFAVELEVKPDRPSAVAREEGARLRALLDVAAAPPPDDVVVNARAQERASRLERLKDPAAVADALGHALLAGDAGLVDKELAALAEVGPADVATAAAAAAAGPRVVVRTLGAAK
jgi:hypothetical protein